jgi:hypothetical protein
VEKLEGRSSLEGPSCRWEGNFLSNLERVSFSGKSLLHEVGWLVGWLVRQSVSVTFSINSIDRLVLVLEYLWVFAL